MCMLSSMSHVLTRVHGSVYSRVYIDWPALPCAGGSTGE